MSHALLPPGPYALALLVKGALVAVLIAFALVNRFVLMPRLQNAPEATLRQLHVSVVLEALVGALVVVAAVVLANQPPPH